MVGAGRNRERRLAVFVLALSVLSLAACGYSLSSTGEASGAAGDTSVVRVTATPSGCQPVPGRVPAGEVQVDVTNLDAPTVSEVELRTDDLSEVLGERENLIEGLSASFSLRLLRGQYIVNCPGAARQHWPLVVFAPRTSTAP